MERTAPLCLKPGLLNDHILRRSCLAFIPISFLFSAPASLAQSEDETPFFIFSGNAALVSDYRFRGVSLSDEDIAIQGGFTVDTEPGFYLGVWGSSIESFNGSETEVDVNFGYGTTWKGFDLSAGVTAYLFPGGTDTDYVEPYISVGRTFGAFSTSFGAAYAPDQGNIGSTDNIYLYNSSALAIGDTPFSLIGSIGWEDGAFGDDKVDWSLGLSASWKSLDFSASYIDTSKTGDLLDATVVFSVGVSF